MSTSNRVRAAFYATLVIFAANGLGFASWASRIPEVSRELKLDNAQLGALLFVAAVGSLIALPLSGPLAARVGTRKTAYIGGAIFASGAVTLGLGLFAASVPLSAIGLFLFGAGNGVWDVAQNLEGAAVEVQMRRSVMAKFHAVFSAGAFLAAMIGAGLSALHVPVAWHLAGVGVVVLVTVIIAPRYFLADPHPNPSGALEAKSHSRTAWVEARTLLIGLVVLGAALTEGSANDWIAKAAVEGLGQQAWAGSLIFAAFILSMTAVRFFGGRLIDRYGRLPVLYVSMGSAIIGLLLFSLSPWLWMALLGVVLWGAGAALGFPTGMSAAADDPARAARRVSVVSTIGYVAFLAGPPAIGFLAQHVHIRPALLAVGAVLLLSFLVLPAAKELPGKRES